DLAQHSMLAQISDEQHGFTKPSRVISTSLLRTVVFVLFKEAIFYADWLPLSSRYAIRGYHTLTCVVSRRASKASAAALGPPAAAKPAATRLAPAVMVIASRTLTRSRSGCRRLAGSRVPAPVTSTRRATSSWSRPKGTTQTGTPRASAFWVAPMPPWVMAQTAAASTGPWGMKRSTWALAGGWKRAGSPAGSVATTATGSLASASKAVWM